MHLRITPVLLAGMCLAFTSKGPEPAPAAGKAAPAAKSAKPAATHRVVRAKGVSGRMAAFFGAHNLAVWWREQLRYAPQYHGFVGGDFYRVDVVFTSVRRDAEFVNVYHVRGKQRFKGVINSFSGSFTLNNLDKQAPEGVDNNGRASRTIVTGATGQYRFQLTPASRGVLSGDVRVDMAPNPYPLGVVQPVGFTFDGEWRRPDGQYKGMMWSDNIYALGNQVLGDFEVGERGPSINYKYMDKGWNTFWENDEWWTAPVARRK